MGHVLILLDEMRLDEMGLDEMGLDKMGRHHLFEQAVTLYRKLGQNLEVGAFS